MESAIHISLKGEQLWTLAGIPMTNSLLLSTLVLVVLAIVTFFARKRFTLVPNALQNIIEYAMEMLLGLMDSVLGSRKKSEKYFPFIATIFFFVIISNWSGLLPGVGSFGLHEGSEFVPFLRAPAADLNFTLALALSTVIAVNFFGILALGFRSHLSKFITFKNPVAFFIGILELISEFAKIISFSFRLFGNIFAGEVLLIIVGFLVPYGIPLPFLLLEIFVGFIQAFVFAMLALVFTAIATIEHEPASHEQNGRTINPHPIINP
jgi:F-type H+-transporting ATPase subunit a